jgi:hypothetical protein
MSTRRSLTLTLTLVISAVTIAYGASAASTASAVSTALAAVPASAKPTCTPVESWRRVGVDTFPLPEGGLRSQGIATDGHQWFFSWKFGLERADNTYADTTNNPVAIPPELLLNGSNHIGDIDYFKGRLVVPIEDGSAYLRPYLALYDAATLQPISYDAIARELQVEGVPWVAVDAQRGIAYTAEWNNAKQINMFDIEHHFAFLGAIPLQQPISRIQGAKLFEGNLLASVDDNAKTVYRIDLSTGAETKLFSIGKGGELEGIAIRPTTDGALVHVMLMVGTLSDPQNYHGEMYHYARTVSCA